MEEITLNKLLEGRRRRLVFIESKGMNKKRQNKRKVRARKRKEQ